MRHTSILIALSLAVGCGPVPGPSVPTEVEVPDPPVVLSVPSWTPVFVSPEPLGQACRQPAFASRLPWQPADWSGLSMGAPHAAGTALHEAGLLVSDGRPAIYDALRERPGSSPCLLEELRAAHRDALELRPVTEAIRLGAAALGSPIEDQVEAPPAVTFEAARDALCDVAGGCALSSGAPSPALRGVLTPLFVALKDTLQAQDARFEGDGRGPDWWREHGGHFALIGRERPNPGFPSDRAQILDDRRQLYAASARLAFTVESTDWPAGLDETYTLPTGRGQVLVLGAGPDVHSAGEVLLRIDLGGDDLYLDGSEAAVNLSVDLGGRDVYAYPGAESATSASDLPDDGAGRGDVEGLAAQASLSEVPRQGAARGGVSLHFDLGEADDRYVTLRGGQGYAHLGVGVLFDAGGDDVYLAEAGAQGAAQLGIGLLIDLGAGADRREALYAAQGFAGPNAFGALIDDGGDDVYRCPEAPARYPSPQRPEANASFCQGASLGFRADSSAHSLPGGLGLLYDAAGDDAYEGAVFAQGVGYWMGTGVLLDGAGSDHHRHVWYAAGAGVHFGVGALLASGADADVYGDEAATHMTLGAAHHFGVGLFFEEGGDDTYLAPTLAAGAASCAGLGLFVDEAGADGYAAPHGSALGVSALGTCEEAGTRPTRALFLDVQGADAYPAAMSEAEDGGEWSHCVDEDPTILAAGRDL